VILFLESQDSWQGLHIFYFFFFSQLRKADWKNVGTFGPQAAWIRVNPIPTFNQNTPFCPPQVSTDP